MTSDSNTIYSVQHFFDSGFINSVINGLVEIPKDWWHVAMYPSDSRNIREEIRYYNELESDPEFIEKKAYNISYFNDGNFSYKFNNIWPDNHYDTCTCICCIFYKYFKSDETKAQLSKVVGEPITTINECFFSKYEQGDYLSVHHDKEKGDYAFVFNLTENWNPAYGGMLHFYDKSKNSISRTVIPEFNSLTVFKLKNVPNTDHFVSMNVSVHPRYAFTGWFSA